MLLTGTLHIEKRDGYHLVIDPAAPNWLATNAEGAWVIQRLRAGESREDVAYRYAKRVGCGLSAALRRVASFADEVGPFASPACGPVYRGRANHLALGRLRELWLHVTDRCNLSCRHCLVSSGPAAAAGPPPELLADLVRQACDLGADTFYFTGGEPLLRRDIPQLLRGVAGRGATAVVLTNGTLLDEELCAILASLPRERLFLQISLDGSCAERNDAIRSPGSFDGAVRGIRYAVAAGLNVTVATVVLGEALDDLVPLADVVRRLGVRRLHLMWQHVRERGAAFPRPRMEALIEAVLSLAAHARDIGLVIDNIENVRRVVNGDPGVKYDLSNACWDSLAVYRDCRVFPSACLVGVESQSAGSLQGASLRDTWRESEVLARWRQKSVIDAPGADADPLLFLHGGGDPEQAFFASGDGRGGADPYLPLHRALARAAMDEIAHHRKRLLGSLPPGPVVYHMMGDDGYGCPIEAGARATDGMRIDFVHSNCVLIQDVIAKSRAEIQRYYGEAAREPKGEICSPVAFDPRLIAHVPEEIAARSYGCGSPVLKAGVREGERVLDLGSGAGLECFLASRLVGRKGRVIGVDMTGDMLSLANGARAEVSQRLGYDNVSFVRGLLEDLGFADASFDAVVSNCVVNLSPEKLKVFAEIRRVLKPGGRLVISDIVSRRELPQKIRFNPRLRGECIAGALTQAKLLRMLEKLGFVGAEVMEQTLWRTVEEVEFDSVTVRAWKPAQRPVEGYTYPGPFRAVVLESGEELRRGVAAQVACGLLPPAVNGQARARRAARLLSDCMVCGAPLIYLGAEKMLECSYCGRVKAATAQCEAGHFVCDECHAEDHTAFIKSFCATAAATDPIALFLEMRAAHQFPLHGPEHHALVPAAFLTAYRNRFGEPPAARIEAAIQRGAALSGGTCAYWGACAAALGIGIAYSAIRRATPLSSAPRAGVQTVVSRILAEIGRHPAPRCCRRESLLALTLGCELSAQYLPNALAAARPPACDQTARNRECAHDTCPFHSSPVSPR
jgi:MoaA/NifB/PqqE/SkfB family radical SAM enzyme/ubiquinone/menaquinone biosynthesis C-methylase UbiE